MKLLHEKYGIIEEDFISAELEAVPAMNARDLGLDRSLIGAYGHDDRVCAYAELAAIFDMQHPAKTAVCIFADKEEIGSEGVSGMQVRGVRIPLWPGLWHAQGVDLRECLANSFCLSADVTAAYDPNFADVYEAQQPPTPTMASASASTPAAAARAVRPMPPPRSSARSARSSTTTA